MNDVTMNGSTDDHVREYILGAHAKHPAFGIRRVEVDNPPHAPELEAAFSKEIDALVDKGDAFAAERIKQAQDNLIKLVKHLSLVSRRVKLVLKAHHETVTAVRKQAEEISHTCDELTTGHQKLIDMLDKD